MDNEAGITRCGIGSNPILTTWNRERTARRGCPFHTIASVAQLVLERYFAKVEVVGSSPTTRSTHIDVMMENIKPICKTQVTHKWWCANLPSWNRVGSIPITCSCERLRVRFLIYLKIRTIK
jgi:hypothetical protein